MAKRKAGVSDIIFELDNDDIVISSDEEGKESKIGRYDGENGKGIKGQEQVEGETHSDVIYIDSPNEAVCHSTSPNQTENGGKNTFELTSTLNCEIVNPEMNTSLNGDVIDITGEIKKRCPHTIIFNEDIVVDSPSSNTDLGVVGCENRAPLVSVRFKDNFLAHNYKKRIKDFIVNLLKSPKDISTDSETDNDNELDIWPEDLVEEEFDKPKENSLDENLFFIDTAPCNNLHTDIPTYSQATNIITNDTFEEATPKTHRRGPTCFNCEGAHQLKDCTLPRDNTKINERRKAMTPRMGRYHLEDEQKYGHLVPGRISGELRHALGLQQHELPLHIYRMRLLGYPPGWLEEARITHSGITLFDSTGKATLDPEEEEGEVNEPGSKDKFDIRKIMDFPGFNVPASSRYIEEGVRWGAPPAGARDSKAAMLRALAPSAQRLRRRRPLFPAAPHTAASHAAPRASMDLDSGDEAEFPSAPPLPDAPPPTPPPPPPAPSGHPQEAPERTTESAGNVESGSERPETEEVPPGPGDLEVIEVERVTDIPIPEEDLITIDDDDESSICSDRNSPSLDDLEKRKRRLLDALEGDGVSLAGTSVGNDDSSGAADGRAPGSETPGGVELPAERSGTPGETGRVRGTQYGTPVLNLPSLYHKLPSDDKFAKHICDIINFENLPNSVGKFRQISNLLKKVKSQVERMHDS